VFNWLKNAVRDAILSGVNEAVAELAGAKNPVPSAPTVTLLLPSYGPATEPEEEQEAPTRGRKAKAS
jgi:hypothetical protein